MIRKIFLGALLTLLVGCASAPQLAVYPQSIVDTAKFEEALEAYCPKSKKWRQEKRFLRSA